MTKREVRDGALHAGGWTYVAPSACPDAEGRTLIAGMYDGCAGWFHELALDAEDMPWERRRAPDGDASHASGDDPRWERLSVDEFADRLAEFGPAVAGTSLESWRDAYDDALQRASLAHGLMLREDADDGDVDPVMAIHVVYDLFDGGAGVRTMTSPDRSPAEFRLEKLVFNRRRSGGIEVFIQVGWFAGSHYDGGGGSTPIPEEWLAQPWDGFLTRFCGRFPPEECSFTKAELMRMDGLKRFLGF